MNAKSHPLICIVELLKKKKTKKKVRGEKEHMDSVKIHTLVDRFLKGRGKEGVRDIQVLNSAAISFRVETAPQ